MRRFLPELVALPMLPFLIAQGKYTRYVTPRLPEADGPAEGVAGAIHAGEPISLLALGESPVAGVGVETHEEGITGQFALALSTRIRRPVRWRACGKNGVTASEALEEVVPLIPEQPVDIALVAFGVNDTTAFRPVTRWRNDLHAVVKAVEARCSPGLIVLSGVPPLRYFPALPQPLRWVMGLKSNVLDLAVRELAAELPGVCYVPPMLDTTDRAMMASDGYHPSAKGCAFWAQLLAEAAAAKTRV
ncbi:SGNH/GDSL hydrolase family protein [Herbaspirillum sp. HC18]|nr:SGNH/GDSL hydrolase family protein [Herbaspirillum sp. HC18]